ncbi:MAG: hypothetical protein ACR2QG_08550 [Gammaproteobacteria bacterium]
MVSKAVKRAGGFVVSLLVMLALGIVVLFIMLPQQRPAPEVNIDFSQERLARGEYLFNNVLGCPVCHSERDWSKAGAPPMPPIGGGRECLEQGARPTGLGGNSGFPGRICFRNISSDPEAGVGAWSDGELWRAIREGIGRHDQALFPIMPYFIYNSLSNNDTKAVITYLRTLAPVNRALPETEITFPTSLFIRFLPRPVYEEVPDPDQLNTVRYGAYLARVARCEFCHSPRNNRNRLPEEGLEFSGGVEFQGNNGLFMSTNLTPHETGLGDMSRTEFIALFRNREGAMEGNVDIMPWSYFSGMTDDDLGAIYDFLQSLPSLSTADKDI